MRNDKWVQDWTTGFNPADAEARIRYFEIPIATTEEREKHLRKLADMADNRGKKVTERILREELQRQVAKAKKKAMKALLEPKEDREMRIKKARDKRCPVFAESGRLVAALGGLGVGVVAHGLYRLLRKASNVCDNVSSMAEGVKSSMSGFAANVKKQLDRLKKKMSHPLFTTIAVVVLSYYVLRIVKRGSFAQRALLVALTAFAGKPLWDRIAKFFLHCDTVRPLGECLEETEADPVVPMSGAGVFSSILASAMCFSIFGAGFSNRTVSEAMKRISLLERTKGGLEVFGNWAIGSIEVLLSFFSKLFGGPYVRLRKETDVALKRWCREVEALEHVWNLNKVDASPAELDKLMNLCARGVELKELYRDRMQLYSLVSAMLVRLHALFAPYQGSISARNNFRVEPEFMVLAGEPGIGKTILMMPMCAYILKMSGLLSQDAGYEEVVENIWQKGASEYWNGYCGQKGLIMDDAFQNRPDSTDKDNEYINVIKMVNSWAMPLNFADLASKGKIYFNSPLILATTNMKDLRTPANAVLFKPDAVTRRISSPYVIELRPEFATPQGRLNIEAYNEQRRLAHGLKGVEGFPFHMWIVRRHDFLQGTTYGVAESLSDVLQRVALNLKARVESQKLSEEVLKDFIKGLGGGSSSSGIADGVKAMSGVPLDDEDSLFDRTLKRTSSELIDFELAAEAKEFEKQRSTFSRWFGSAKGHVQEHWWKYAIGLATFKAASMAISILLDLISPEDKRNRDKLLAESNRPLSGGGVQSGAKVRYVSAVKPQGGNDPIISKVYNNTMKLTVEAGDKVNVLGQITFVSSDMAFMPHHFRARLLSHTLVDIEDAESATVTFTHALSSTVELTMSVKRFLALPSYALPDRDIEFVSVSLINAPKNIIKNFLTEADLKYVPGKLCRLDVMEVDDRQKVLPRPRHAIYTSKVGVSSALRYEGYHLQRYASYAVCTSAGDCGAPLSLENAPSFGGRRTFGMHVAGRENRAEGFSTFVTQELLREAMAKLGTIDDQSEEDIFAQCGGMVTDTDQLPDEFGGTFLPLYRTSRQHQLPLRSKLFKTPLYGVFGEHRYFPAVMKPVMRDGVLLKPMVNATKVYSGPLRCLDTQLLEQALHVAMKPHAKETALDPRIVFSYEDAVLGRSEMMFRSVPRGTSAGFPYMYDMRGGKRDFWGDDIQGYDLDTAMSQQLKVDVQQVIDDAKLGIRRGHVFVDLLKDETRKLSKVQAAATRLISSSPLRYTIAFRRYFGAFCASTMSSHTVTGMSPGINCYQEWSLLSRLLESKGGKVFAGDIKGLDASELPDLHLAILDYINRWYGGSAEDSRVRQVLWMELYHSRHLGGDGLDQTHIYQWNKSLPSGHPMTTIVNSMYTLTALVACYIKATGDAVGFWDHVYAAVYGDDNAINVDDIVAAKFNQRAVAEQMLEHFGIVYTSDDKEAELIETTTIDRISFLKRRFQLNEVGTYDAALELDSFLYSVYWAMNKKDLQEIMSSGLENALCELSLHTQEVWDEWAPRILEVMAELNGPNNTAYAPTRRAYRAAVAARADAWF